MWPGRKMRATLWPSAGSGRACLFLNLGSVSFTRAHSRYLYVKWKWCRFLSSWILNQSMRWNLLQRVWSMIAKGNLKIYSEKKELWLQHGCLDWYIMWIAILVLVKLLPVPVVTTIKWNRDISLTDLLTKWNRLFWWSLFTHGHRSYDKNNRGFWKD